MARTVDVSWSEAEMNRVGRAVRQHLRRVLKALFEFLVRRPWALWVGLGAPALLVWAGYAYPPRGALTPDERVVAASLLEIGGLILIANGYAQLREHFGRPGMWASFRTFVREFFAALRPPQPRVITASGAGSVGLAGTARATLRAGPNSPIERRLEILEGRVESLDNELHSHIDRSGKESSELKRQLAVMRSEVDTEVRALKVLVEKASVGDAGSEVIGWLWLLGGIVTSSWSSWGGVLAAVP